MLFFSKKSACVLMLALVCGAVSPLAGAEKAVVLRKYDFNKGTLGWITPGYWTGKTVHNASDGTMILTPDSRNGSPISGRAYTQSGLEDTRGLKMVLSCRVRGTGKVRLGAYLAALSPKGSKWDSCEPVTLTGDWQEIQYPMDFTRKDYSTVWPYINLITEGKVEFDDVVITAYSDADTTAIKGEKFIRRHIDGAPFPAVEFSVSEPEAEFAVFAGDAKLPEAPVMLKSDAVGKLTVPGDIIKRRSDNKALVTVARNGVNCRTEIELISAEQFQKLDDAAAKIKFDTKTDIAVFADSLWDFDRSWNAADELEFWLGKHNDAGVKVHNFAVRGNSIVTDELRFYQQPSSFLWNANRKMFDPNLNPQIVIFQLGHNDTRSFSKEKFAKPWVSTAEQRSSFERMIVNVRRMWPQSRIILVTPVANDTDYLAKKSENEVKRGQLSWRFGDREKVAAYIAELKNIAQKYNLEVCDIYTPMSQIADRQKTMFRADGVHLVRQGYWYLAEQILSYLGSHNDAPAIKPLNAPAPFCGKFELKTLPAVTTDSGAPVEISSTDKQRKILGFGKLSRTKEGTVALDGNTGGFGLADSVTFNPAPAAGKGMTLSMTAKNNALTHPQHKAMFSSYFFKTDQFLLCRHNRSLYFNYHTGSNWGGGVSSSDVFEEDFGNEEYHHIAATIYRHKVPSQGEDWLEVKLYLDGEKVAHKRLNGVDLRDSRFPLEIGSASYLGSVWRAKADIAEVEIVDKVLSEDEIEELFARQRLVKKKRTGIIDEKISSKLNAMTAEESRKSALRNLAMSGMETPALEKYFASPDKYLLALPGKDSVLTLFTEPGKVRIVSWYDKKSRREILAADSPIFSVNTELNKRSKVLSPLSAGVKSDFTVQPQQQDGGWNFTVKSDLGSNAWAETEYTWVNDRLEIQLSVNTENSPMIISQVNQPDLRLNPLCSPEDTLLVPIMSGVEYPAAASSGATYTDIYPHGTAAMQLGAYYDRQSGIYWTILDPKASYKHLRYSAGTKRMTVEISFPVPGPVKSPQKSYTASGPAVVELFRGNWYDAGLLYRRDLARMKAPWWRETLPNTDTPEWFRNELFSIRRLSGTVGDVPILEKLKNYLECSFLINGGGNTGGNLYSPLVRTSAESVAWLRDIQKLGLRSIPYTDPRLWQVHDRRNEDYSFTSEGKKHCVVEDGKVLMERYGIEYCGVVCPVSTPVQDIMTNFMLKLSNVGFDGIYSDQIGAARPNLCENPDHGHTVRDASVHYVEGWRKIFMNLRKAWAEQGEHKIIVTEDNAEHCVGMMDAMLPWRWMYDNQVPLFPMIYAGRTQFIAREPDCEEPRAIYPKAASQIINGEQAGYMEHQLVVSPLRHSYRVFLKQILHLRGAMLEFFNEGMMARPVDFASPWKKVPMTWGVRGTGVVSSPDVFSSAWRKGDFMAIALINHTPDVKENTLLYKLPFADNQIMIFKSNDPQTIQTVSSQDLNLPITMAPRSCMLILAAPAGTDMSKVAAVAGQRFEIIRRAPQTPDPFVLDELKMRDRTAGKSTDLHQAKDIAEVSGGRRDIYRNQINWIRDAVASVGTVDFGDGSASVMEVAFAAPARCGFGTVGFYIDSFADENKIAEFEFDGKNFSTADWNTFSMRRTDLLQKVTGSHRVFIKLEGNSFCNFQSWQLK